MPGTNTYLGNAETQTHIGIVGGESANGVFEERRLVTEADECARRSS
jgi:hypothetical protein